MCQSCRIKREPPTNPEYCSSCSISKPIRTMNTSLPPTTSWANISGRETELGRRLSWEDYHLYAVCLRYGWGFRHCFSPYPMRRFTWKRLPNLTIHVTDNLPDEGIWSFDFATGKGQTLSLPMDMRWADSFAKAPDESIYFMTSQTNYPLEQRGKYEIYRMTFDE